MNIGVMSDSHGNLPLLKKAGTMLRDTYHAEVIIHLGDDSIEAEVLKGRGCRVIEVPGVYEAAYEKSSIANRRIVLFDGWRFLVTHTKTAHEHDLPGDINPHDAAKNREIDAVLFGHTHIPGISEEEGIIFINPGHLKPDDKKGHPPSFAVVKTSERSLKASLIDLEKGTVTAERVFTK
ncbi:MAG: YfcE family phosphodiesterase [Candidatus Eremiobacteraeota bacterium]|nr:YfcE family phosphodiesterase [Candidatus Eremiobacteraeota bacterium]